MRYIILLSGIMLSVMAGYLSILGMQAIFPGDPLLIGLIIGTIEFSKYATAIWVHSNWYWINFKHKVLSSSLMVVLALLTSMSIFGFFSKQHLESGRDIGNVSAKIQIIDSKIEFEKQNIDNAKKSIEQLNKVVDEIVSRSDKEKSIITANRIRNQQKKERLELNGIIEASTDNIQKLNEEKFPLEAESRSATIEVGAVKYIAELIYGESSQEILEKAVRFVIIALVFVFDPFAIYLLIIFDMKKEEPTVQPIPELPIPEPPAVPAKSRYSDVLERFELNKKSKESFKDEELPKSPILQASIEEKSPQVSISEREIEDDEVHVATVHGIKKINSDGLTMYEKE